MDRAQSLLSKILPLLESAKWVFPDDKNLRDEWANENIDAWFFNGYPKKEQVQEYLEVFISNFKKFTSVKVLTPSAINTLDPRKPDYYKADTISDLQSSTAYMHKDIQYLVDRMQGGHLYMPIMLLKDGVLSTVGGRTRLSVARLLGVNVHVAVIDYTKMSRYFAETKEQDFIAKGFGAFALATKDTRYAVLDLLKGGLVTIDVLLELIRADKRASAFIRNEKDLNDWIGKLKRHLYGSV